MQFLAFVASPVSRRLEERREKREQKRKARQAEADRQQAIREEIDREWKAGAPERERLAKIEQEQEEIEKQRRDAIRAERLAEAKRLAEAERLAKIEAERLAKIEAERTRFAALTERQKMVDKVRDSEVRLLLLYDYTYLKLDYYGNSQHWHMVTLTEVVNSLGVPYNEFVEYFKMYNPNRKADERCLCHRVSVFLAGLRKKTCLCFDCYGRYHRGEIARASCTCEDAMSFGCSCR